MANRVKNNIKTHCKRGHDISVTGRYVNGACIACNHEATIKLRKGPRPKVQFCPHGHDTFICGRDKKNYCKLCAKKPHKARAKKQFCVNGHDSVIVGREKGGGCKKCKANWQRVKRAKEKLTPKIKLCKKGHNLDVVGRTKYNRCKLCLVQYGIDYREKNKDEINRKLKERLLKDINFKLKTDLRTRLWQAIKSNQKAGSAVQDLGCTIPFLKDYIAAQFHDGMTWDNWGKVWQLDHIKELWEFDLTDREQFLIAVNYKNLQPLAKPDHIKKTTVGLISRKSRKKFKF